MKKRLLSLFLTMALCLGLLPTAALADAVHTDLPAAQEQPETTAQESASSIYTVADDTIAVFAGNATEENAAAVVNGTDYYSSFDEAYAAAQDGDTIQLRQNIDNNSTGGNRITVAQGQSLTIDLNGCELYRYITVEGTLTLKGEAGGIVFRDITVLGTLVMTGSAQIQSTTSGDTMLILGSTERGGTLDVQSDNAYISAMVKVINKGDTALSHGKFTKFDIKQADTCIMDLLAEGYAFYGYSSVWNANKTSKEFGDGSVVSIKTHKHYFSNENTYDCKCGYHCEHIIDPDTGACINCHTQFKKARIGSEFYDSLDTALTAAAAQEGCTVTLLCDAVASLTVASGSFTIDLGGHTWETSQYPALKITNGVSLTVQNGTIKSTSTAQFGAAITLDGGSLTVGQKLICRGTYGINAGSNSITLADDTVLLGGLLIYLKAPADLLPAGTAFAQCSVSEDGTVQIGDGFVTSAYKTGSLRADMAVVSHTHDFGTGTCVCGLTAAAEVNGKIYQTLAAAIQAAADGSTVRLLAGEAGSGENITVAADSTVTIDLNSKELAAQITVLGTLRLDQSNSEEYGKISDLTVGNADAAGALELLSDHIRIIKLTANQTDGIELDKGQFHAVYCPEGATLLSVLKEGYAFKGRTWNQNSFAYQASGLYAEVVECDHPSTIYSGAPVSAFENYHCKYCNYACPHDGGFHYDYDKGLVCSICGYSAAAYVSIGSAGDTGQSFASLSEAVAFANSNADSTDKFITLRLYSNLYGNPFTATGKWTLNFDKHSLSGMTITIGSDTTPGYLTFRNDYDNVEAGTVTVTSGSYLRTTRLEIGNGKLIFPSLTVQKGASASLSIGNFWSIKNEGGSLADLLPGPYYAFENNGTIINAHKLSEMENVAVVRHTHTIDPASGFCACGFQCDHSAGYLNGVCTKCGMRCPHPLDQIDTAKNECTACRASLLATMTPEGGTTAYFSDLTHAFESVPENDSATITLLQDTTLFGVNTDQYYGDLGRTLIGNADVIGGRTVTLDMNGHTLTSSSEVITVGFSDATKTSGKLILTGTGDLRKPDNSFVACIQVLHTGILVTDGWNGRMDNLSLNGGTVQLSGGTFGKIGNDGDTVKLGDLLADGCAFQDLAGNPIPRSDGIAANGAMGNIAVARCVKHAADSADDPCIYCGATGFAAQVVMDGKTYYYTTLPAAIKEANKTSGKIAITLLKDVTNLDQALVLGGGLSWTDNSITLDLNGKTLSGTGGSSNTFLTVDTFGTVTICDSDTTGRIKNTNPGVHHAVSVSLGTLTITGGSFEGSSSAQTGMTGYAASVEIGGAKLIITGGIFKTPVRVNGNLTVSGGTFTSLFTVNSATISTLLKDGYTFKATGGAWLTEDELAQTTATNITAVEAPIQSLTLTSNAADNTVEYGTSVTLTANYTAAEEYGNKVQLMWHNMTVGSTTKPETGSDTSLEINGLPVGEYKYRVTATADGYSKSADITFTITPRDLSKAEVTYIATEHPTVITYNPLSVSGTPSPQQLLIAKVTLGDMELKEGVDYTISGDKATDVGNYKAILTAVEGSTKCKGTLEIEWEIVPFKLGSIGVPNVIKEYDGSTALPENARSSFDTFDAGVTFGALRLKYGTECTLTHAEFVDANVGEGKALNITVKLLSKNYIFDPDAFTNLPVTVSEDGKTATYTNWEVDGTSRLAITPADVPVFTKEVTFDKIVNDLEDVYVIDLPTLPRLSDGCEYGKISYKVDEASLDALQQSYGNGAVSASIAVGEDNRAARLVIAVPAVQTSYEGGIGAIKVTVTPTNYNPVSLTVNLGTVNKSAPTIFVSPSTTILTYGMTLADITLTAKAYDVTAPVSGIIVWDAPNTMPNVGEDQKFGWTFTPDDTEHYRSVSGSSRITVEPATPAGAPKYTPITASGKKLSDAGLAANESWPAGTVKWVDKEGKELAATTEVKANTAYQWKFTPDSSNYNAIGGSITLYSVSTGGGGSLTTYPVNTPSKTENGSVSVSTKNAFKGDTVTITVKPDDSFKLADLTVTDKDGNLLKTTDQGNGKYTFIMPAGRVEVKAAFVEEVEASPFTDVSTDAYYYEAVKWAAEQGITGGIGNHLFGPDQPCTRAQIVTFLWRAAGSPEPKTMSSFTDIPADSYYAKAVAWAVENGITVGTSGATFSPEATCTRAQSVTFLFRAAKASADGTSAFSDVAANAYYAEAVKWAADNGITNGIGGNLFGVNNDCTRAQIVTFLWRSYIGK